MARKYELKARAERQQETRRRIVEAAIELHRTKGPAQTTVSDIAGLAGVQRHTLYRHFPDARSLGLACSGHFTDLNPRPDPQAWRGIADPYKRLQRGLSELYDYFERTEDMMTCVLRDAQVDPLTREMLELRSAKTLRAIRDVLAQGLPRRKRARAALELALDFHAWKQLVRNSGLSNAEAVETMVRAVRAQ
jgi:AcrR family transcriptional regulator